MDVCVMTCSNNSGQFVLNLKMWNRNYSGVVSKPANGVQSLTTNIHLCVGTYSMKCQEIIFKILFSLKLMIIITMVKNSIQIKERSKS